MICQYCGTEHQKKEKNNPFYCMDKMTVTIEKKNAEIAEWKRVASEQAKLHDDDCRSKDAEIARLHKGWTEANIMLTNAETDIAALKERVRELEDWKDSQLLIESSWNPQAVAKELEVPLGADIRKYILPGIVRIKERVRELETYKADIENAVKGAMDEQCTLQEKHCTCVPLLRNKVRELKGLLEKIHDLCVSDSRWWNDESHAPDHHRPVTRLLQKFNKIAREAKEAK